MTHVSLLAHTPTQHPMNEVEVTVVVEPVGAVYRGRGVSTSRILLESVAGSPTHFPFGATDASLPSVHVQIHSVTSGAVTAEFTTVFVRLPADMPFRKPGAPFTASLVNGRNDGSRNPTLNILAEAEFVERQAGTFEFSMSSIRLVPRSRRLQCDCGSPVTAYCGACHATAYCGTECQSAGWATHAKYCVGGDNDPPGE